MTEELDLGLEQHFREITSKQIQDAGLYPGFIYFHANTETRWLDFIPGRCNILQNAYLLENFDFGDVDRLHDARIVFLDSGALSPLVAVTKGQTPPYTVLEWMDRQDMVLKWAHNLHQAGVTRAVVASLDLPQYDTILKPAGVSRSVAMELTLRNAKQFAKAWYDGELPPGFTPVFPAQGVRIEEYLECMDALDDYGILGMIREGEAWLAVGGARDASPPALLTICRSIRERLGPVGHIHSLGIGRMNQLVPLARMGYVNSSDSSSTTTEVLFNRGPYAFRSDRQPRPRFLTEAQWAAAALHYEARLAQALERAHAGDVYEQGMLV